MMRRIVAWSLKFRLMVLAAAVGLMVLGVTQFRSIPVDIFPEFSPPRVEIQTEALGLSAAEVEQLITVPMEADLLNGVAWLETIRSESLPNLSRVELIFEPGTDIMRARQVVQERLAHAPVALPRVSKLPQMIQPVSSTSRVMAVGMSSENLSPIELSVLARWRIRPRLMGLGGVANVAIWGQRERQLQVRVDPNQLRRNDVALSQIIETTGNALWVSPLSFLQASTPGAGGFIDGPNQRLEIRHVLPITTPQDLARVAVEGTGGNGRPLRLGDVTKVVEDHQPLIGDASGPDLLLVVEKFPWANTIDVTRNVENALETMQPGLPTVVFDTSIFRSATFVESTMGSLGTAIAIGLILMALIVGALLFRWRTVAVVLIAISLSLLAAGAVLYVRGTTINVMVLAGLVIALAIIIDDAIIGTEAISHRLRNRRDEGDDTSSARIILDAALEAHSPILYATLIVIVAMVPLALADGLTGSFFRPLAITYGLAIVASMVVALIVTPALSLTLLANAPQRNKESPLTSKLRSSYNTTLAKVIRKPRPVVIGIAVLLLAGLAVTPVLSREMIPSLKERDILVQWEGRPGTSHPEMARITGQVNGELRELEGVKTVAAHVGRAIMSDQAVNINSGELWVSLDEGADYDATVSAIRDVVNAYPGFSAEVLTYSTDRVRAFSGTEQDLAARIYGPDLDVLQDKAAEVGAALATIDGITAANVETLEVEPTVEIEVDLAAAEEFGIKPGDVRRAAATLLSGIEVGNLFEDQKVFEVVVWGTAQARNSLSTVRNLRIDTPDGDLLRLGDVADVSIRPNQTVYRHDAVSRYVDVALTADDRDASEVAGDVERALQDIDFPLEYHGEVIGGFVEREAAGGRMLGFGFAALVGIFLLLQAALGSWRIAAVMFLALPLALIGGVFGAVASGGIISIGSIAGFVAVLGIATRNGIMLIRRYQYLQLREEEPFGADLVLHGTRERFEPIAITAAATALVFAPLLVLGNEPGHEVVYPMAAVVVGGLITSTFLNLFVVPILYLRFGHGTELSGRIDFDLTRSELDAA